MSSELECIQRRALLDDSINRCIGKLHKNVIKWVLSGNNSLSETLINSDYNKNIKLLSQIVVKRKLSELVKKRNTEDVKLYQQYQTVVRNQIHLINQSIQKAEYLLGRDKMGIKMYQNVLKHDRELLKKIQAYPTVSKLRDRVRRLQKDVKALEGQKPYRK